MPVQTLYLDVVRFAEDLRYAWAEDGTLLLTIDCNQSFGDLRRLSYAALLRELKTLGPWQLAQNVVMGTRDALAEIYTAYHDFDFAIDKNATLMLVSTPPDEYFEAHAA